MDRPPSIPVALWRRVCDRAGADLPHVLRSLLRLYADGLIDPLAANPIGSAAAARGGRARADRLTHEERRAGAQRAARARWGHPPRTT